MTLAEFIATANQDGLRVALVAPFTGNIVVPDLARTQALLLLREGPLLQLTADDRLDAPHTLLDGFLLVRHTGQLQHDYLHQQPFKPAA